MKNRLKVALIIGIFMLSACSSGDQAKEGPKETSKVAPKAASKEELVWVPGWKKTSELAIARAGAAVVVNNGFIYMIAGVDGKNFLKITEYAKVQEDGSLGPWMIGPSLNEERGFNEAIVKDGYIYIAGGANGDYGSNLLVSVERAKILSDGSLSAWETEQYGTMIPRRCSKVVEWDNYIFSVGGYGGVMLDSIDRAEIQPDGTIGQWTLDKEKMLVPHYVNGVKAKKGYLYAFGGHDANRGVGIDVVEFSKISKTGELSPWKHTSPLQVGRYGLATASHGKYFYVLGGLTGTEYLDSIEKAKIKSNGELSPWEFTSPLATIRVTYSVAVYKDWIYAISGTSREGYYTTVDYASFNDKGDIGYWGTKAEKAANDEMLRKRKEASSAKLPLEGIVLRTLQTSAYTYIEVNNKQNGFVWLAAPRVELEDNSTIRYGKGIFMSNFFSKELQQNFPAVFFVGEIQKVK